MSNLDYIKERKLCILYTTATCNLNCNYCYIDKSPILVKIDELLEESFKGDYYFNFMKEMFPDPNQLTEMNFWGGEPSYGLYRVIPTVEKALKYYPNLTTFFMSSNMTTPTVVDDLFNFLNIAKLVSDRHIHFKLQISLDGPKDITDKNRGLGVTEKLTKNIFKLCSKIDNKLEEVPNVTFETFFKPTLDMSCLDKLQTEEQVYKYYAFFERYKDLANRLSFNPNFIFGLGVPNFAMPGEYTASDGKKFAIMCKHCKTIEDKHKLKYYANIMPFSKEPLNIDIQSCINHGCNGCGSGVICLGLLPNKQISVCHQGFVDLLGEYKQHVFSEEHDNGDRTISAELFENIANEHSSTFSIKDYEIFEEFAHSFNKDAVFQVSEAASMIQMLAVVKQIDTRYLDKKEAVKAAHFLFGKSANCMRDNYNVTGSRFMFPTGMMKLFFNGAMELIEENDEHFVPRRTK